jgi:putative transposase
MLQLLVRDVFGVECSDEIGSAQSARIQKRREARNRSQSRRFTTRLGSLDLLIPHEAGGEFQAAYFGDDERSEQAVVAALAEIYPKGRSMCKVVWSWK